jgi:hypothetical protein
MMESVRLVLQPKLIDDGERLLLWKKSSRRQAYLVGFMRAAPNDLPEPLPARKDAEVHRQGLQAMAKHGNPCATLLLRVQSASGQTFVHTLSSVLAKSPTQDVFLAALDLARDYFSPLRPEGDPDLSLEALSQESRRYAGQDHAPQSVRRCCEVAPDLRAEVVAMRLLSGVGYGMLRPLLRDATVGGSLMRRKLEPVTDCLLGQLGVLQGKGSDR